MDNLNVELKKEKFELLQDFENIFINKYDHLSFLKEIKEKTERLFFNCSENITDKHFSNVSEKIQPFEIYSAKAYISNQKTSFEEILSFMKEEGASLLGVQGLFLLWRRKRDFFERGYSFVSLDEKKGMWSYLENKYATAVLKHKKSGYIFNAEIEKLENIISDPKSAFLFFTKTGGKR